MKIVAIFLLITVSVSSVLADESVCYGTTTNGWLENGVQIPSDGNNYESYSFTAELLGRTYVHSKVRTIIVHAYKHLETERKGTVYKYAETGSKEGGRFWPHKSHQNGLSADFMVPVVNKEGSSVHLPTHPFNKFGYSIEFDANGMFDEYVIDYQAMGAHIVALDTEAKIRGVGLWRVLFDPKLQPYLLTTKYGKYLQNHIQFSRKRSWVRHDEHYHVDFEISCKPI